MHSEPEVTISCQQLIDTLTRRDGPFEEDQMLDDKEDMDFEGHDNEVDQGWWLNEQEESYQDYLAGFVSQDVDERIVEN